MTPLTSPVMYETPENQAENRFPGYPMGLDFAGPDDLGDWWLDLGCVDLPEVLGVYVV